MKSIFKIVSGVAAVAMMFGVAGCRSSKPEANPYTGLMSGRSNVPPANREVSYSSNLPKAVQQSAAEDDFVAPQIGDEGDSLFIAIPPAKVLEVIVNPSDVETFVEKGSWSQQETNELVRIASQHIQDNAVKHKLLEKAEKVGRDKLKEFFKVLHYRYVKIEKPVTETE